ncbi:hypothetical protein HK104_003879 [Borealophlyctis nickersoniae]|nr:hypothetical protein HK104_003879 [Borealophlyctis nickersoniae]
MLSTVLDSIVPDVLPPFQWYIIVLPLLSTLLAYLIGEYLRDQTPAGKPDDAPYRRAYPFVGHFYNQPMDKMVLHGTDAMVALGKVVKLFMPGMRAIIVFDPSVLKKMLVTDVKVWDRNSRIAEIFDPLAGGLALMPNGDRWREARHFFGPFFHTSVVKSYTEIIRGRIANLHAYLCTATTPTSRTPSPIIDLQATFDGLNFDIIATLICGVDPGSLQGNRRLIDAWCFCVDHLMWRFIVKPSYYWKWFKTPDVRRYERSMSMLENMIIDRLHEYETNGVPEGDACVLAEFVRRRNKDPESVPAFLVDDERELVKHLMTFLFAGRDTTSSLLTWVGAYLAEDPTIADRIYAEVSKAEGPLTYELLDRMPYLDAVIKETLRLKPPLPVLFRQPTEARTITWTKPDGTTANQYLGRGQYLMWNSLGVHTHPDHYPDRPNEFVPERWLKNASSTTVSPPTVEKVTPTDAQYTFIPFGAGPRRCVGEKLAMFQAKFILAEMVKNWKWEQANGFSMEIEHVVTLRAKKGIKIRMVPRVLV